MGVVVASWYGCERFDIWSAPDDLAVVIGVAADGTFALYRVAGATLGPVLFDGDPPGSLTLPVWAQGQSAVRRTTSRSSP